ncbi:unnamed protein product [Amoebophrya sp. A25]|nr:unnamed protein product [Amoebophrya sp. A25]|eukprot:GSA25T00005307001.1
MSINMGLCRAFLVARRKMPRALCRFLVFSTGLAFAASVFPPSGFTNRHPVSNLREAAAADPANSGHGLVDEDPVCPPAPYVNFEEMARLSITPFRDDLHHAHDACSTTAEAHARPIAPEYAAVALPSKPCPYSCVLHSF